MDPHDDPVTLNLARIARLAGVGRAAVSNWRRRYPDFPQSAGGTDASPAFVLGEVEAWLLRHKKIEDVPRDLSRLWPKVEDLGDREGMAHVVAAVGERLTEPVLRPPAAAPEPDGTTQALVAELLEAVRGQSAVEAFSDLMERWHGVHVRQVPATPEPLARAAAVLAAGVRGASPVRDVLDPACGLGTFLLAAADQWSRQLPAPTLVGVDRDPAQARLARVRLKLGYPGNESDAQCADVLRGAVRPPLPVDVVLCYPPSNERDWGRNELMSDPRWTYGLPPLAEPELAWIQHCLSVLAADGVAVVVLPPAVSARRAGRRIRAGLVRAGVLRAVVALPVGSAPPYGVGLHLWVLTKDGQPGSPVVFVDGSDCRETSSSGRGTVTNWDGLRERALAALRGEEPLGTAQVLAEDLLDDETDLTPSRHTTVRRAVGPGELRRAWADWDGALVNLTDAARVLSTYRAVATDPDGADFSLVADWERSGALRVVSGRTPAQAQFRQGPAPRDGLRIVTAWRSERDESPWLPTAQALELEAAGQAELTEFGDVVVVTAAGDFDAWVETAGPRLLTAQTVALRPDPELLDPFFLAACLRAPGNGRGAASHASTTSRVDVRRLRVLQAPYERQRVVGEVYRQYVRFQAALAGLGERGEAVGTVLAALLGQGGLSGG
ncbi:N-6 DNA methylase [Kitasatospora sp. NPDC004799]|uniref:N-6 DNA methylase n=1 Tax=Kitasatospora sp. NPDC004799 TaxID=3154460 RepID=UPI0033ADE4DF